ncbi:hypothetical protein D6C90_02667 [Aureobasidium pullulans]|uniref:Zn(2)-C6 fungal-type domain-containing protein n=1 Tax=Aureobasidium pullulans TaxID=5580 RepID=A0A4S9VEM1_AURPU|nr:hypothetical protein D6C90_02667 [Aureobasidium pullulans]
MNHAPHGAPARRSRRVACTECRQQKARCDAGPLPDQPCSRCRKFKLPCVVSNCFKRQHKHRKLSELEHEAEALRLELRGNEYDDAPTNDHHPQQAALGPAPSTSSIRANREFISTAGRCESPSRTADMFGHQSEHHHRSAVRTETSSTHEPGSRNAGPRSSSFPATRTTVAQSLAGVSLTGCEIDGLFSMYSPHCHARVPSRLRFADTLTHPNTYHAQSVFLFWAVISVACRKSRQYVHLFSLLAQPVAELAFLWPTTASNPIHGIQASLLLLTWPFPRFSNVLDFMYPLAGLIFHKVRQAGFHRPKAGHEFYLVEGKPARLTDAEVALRKDLWARCVLSYQSISIAKGHLPGRMIGAVGAYHTETTDRSLELQLQCQDIIVQCCTAISDTGLLSNMSDAQANAVAIIIRVFDTRVRDLEVEKLTRLAKELTQEITGFSTLTVTENLHVQSARLNILVFSLFIPSSGATDDMVELIQLLLSTAKSVLDLVKRVVQLPTFPPSPPNHIVDTFLISTFTILRIAKIYPNNVWVADAESCINSCKLLARSLSSNDNDALFKTGMMLDDLWGNPRAYRKPDGSADAPIGYLGRLSAGLVMDAASKWHEIVDSTSMLGISGLTEGVLIGQQLPIQSSSAAFHDTTTEAMLSFGTGHNAPLSNGEGHYLSMFDDDIFGDFDWYGEMPYA